MHLRMLRVWALPLIEVLCHSASNALTWLKYTTKYVRLISTWDWHMHFLYGCKCHTESIGTVWHHVVLNVRHSVSGVKLCNVCYMYLFSVNTQFWVLFSAFDLYYSLKDVHVIFSEKAVANWPHTYPVPIFNYANEMCQCATVLVWHREALVGSARVLPRKFWALVKIGMRLCNI